MRDLVCVCVCVRAKERAYKTHMNKRQGKRFSSFSNILIFHESLFDVVLNIHAFMLRRKREMMQKITAIHCARHCGEPTFPVHMHK